MKKNILPIALLLSPYLYIFAVISMITSENLLRYFIYFTAGLILAIFIPNIVFALMLKRKESSTRILFWDMFLKLMNIPIYIVVFVIGFLMSILPKGIVITPILIIFDYVLLIPSSIYGISGLIKTRQEKKINLVTAVICSILHFFICVDVIIAIVMFSIVKRKRVSGLDSSGRPESGQNFT